MQNRDDYFVDREAGAPHNPSQALMGDGIDRAELTPELCAELLDPVSWEKILKLYAKTMKLAVALIDPQGNLVGTCHNPQPIWSLAHDAKPEWSPGCLFCISGISSEPGTCTAARDAERADAVVMVHDQAGLAHIAAPLTLGGRHFGTLIAGQVFDRYPEPLRLQRMAKEVGLSAQQVWHTAVQQAPISRANLLVYGDLLGMVGRTVLRERYGTILERKLADTNRRFQLLVDGAKDYAIFTMDAAGLVTSWNAGAEHLLGYTRAEMLGRHFSAIFTPEDVQNGVPQRELQTAARQGRVEYERRHARKDGSQFLANGFLAAVGQSEGLEFGMISSDITERRKTEIALFQAHKMESLGVLAGGIAHDFNNLLTSIMGNASLILETSSELDPDRGSLEDIVASSMRAAELTNQLLAYAGKGRFVITRFDLSELIREIPHLIQASIPKMVRLELALAPDLPWIEADATQIRQIVMNLMINAAEAIGSGGGTVWVSTGMSALEPAEESQPGRFVYLEVRDSGCGMDKATRARIFDPFFTTKLTGRGLGLAAVSGIVRGHNGRMQLESVPGEGTTFRISLPALEGSFPKAVKPVSSLDVHCTGTILVVDDEAMIRQLATLALKRLGYTVLVAENGREAVRIFQEREADITAVLLDMAMPVMNGEQALQRIRAIRPDVPVLVASGDSEMVTRERFADNVDFIQKPYTIPQLAKKIKSVVLKRVEERG
jgi:PAS domain S-box-containing protein